MKSIFGKQFWYLLGLLLATDIAFISLLSPSETAITKTITLR